jgi:hypothetical protein
MAMPVTQGIFRSAGSSRTDVLLPIDHGNDTYMIDVYVFRSA